MCHSREFYRHVNIRAEEISVAMDSAQNTADIAESDAVLCIQNKDGALNIAAVLRELARHSAAAAAHHAFHTLFASLLKARELVGLEFKRADEIICDLRAQWLQKHSLDLGALPMLRACISAAGQARQSGQRYLPDRTHNCHMPEMLCTQDKFKLQRSSLLPNPYVCGSVFCPLSQEFIVRTR